MTKTRVINIYKKMNKGITPYYNIYIGRATRSGLKRSKWGNPYKPSKYGLEKSLELYEKHVRNHPKLMDSLEELIGMILACWCKPSACHGQILLKLIQERFGGYFEDDFTLIINER